MCNDSLYTARTRTLAFFFLGITVFFSQCMLYAQWKEGNGPYGGSIECFTSYNNSLYAGSSSRGVFRSIDSGVTWRPDNSGISKSWVMSLAVLDSTLYAGTYDGIYQKDVSSSNWLLADSSLKSVQVSVLRVSAQTLYAGSSAGSIYISSSRGKTWTKSRIDTCTARVESIAISGTTVVVALYGDGVYVSTNGGTSWIARNSGLSGLKTTSLLFAAGMLFMSTNSSVYKSSNLGVTWTPVSSGLPSGSATSLVYTGSKLIASYYQGGIYTSTNLGTSWSSSNSGLSFYGLYTVYSCYNNLYTGADAAGIYISKDNALTWKSSNEGLSAASVFDLNVNGADIYAASDGPGIYHTSNDGQSWELLSQGLPTSFTRYLSIASKGTYVWVATMFNGVYTSSDKGVTWTSTNSGLGTQQCEAIMAVSSTLFLATGDAGVYRSTTNGLSWTSASTGLANQTVFSLASSGTAIYAGTWGNGVYVSSNGGALWQAANTGIENTYVGSLVASGSFICAATTGHGLCISNDAGNTWSTDRLGDNVRSINKVTLIGNTLFVCADTTIYCSVDYGKRWFVFFRGKDIQSVEAIATRSATIIGGTWGSSSFQSDITQLFPSYPIKDKYCVMDTIVVPVLAMTSFGINNTYSVQLSDSSGSFAAPITIGQIKSSTTDSIVALIPKTVKSGTKYRFRVVSSSPARTADDNGVDISIFAVPTPSIVGKTSLCVKDKELLYVNRVAGVQTTWMSSSANIQITQSKSGDSISIYALSAGTAAVVCHQSNPNGCTVDSTINITLSAIPSPAIKGSDSVCSNQSSVTYQTQKVNGSTYSWFVDQGTASLDTSSPRNQVRITFGSSGVVALRVRETSAGGCSTETTKMIVIGTNLKPEVTSSSGRMSFCVSDSCILNAGIPSASYQWKRNGAIISGATKQQFAVTQTDSYSVYVSLNGCSGESAPQFVQEISIPQPAILGQANICVDQNPIVFHGVLSSGSTCIWRINSGHASIVGSTVQDSVGVVASDTGQVELQLIETSTAGCSRVSTTLLSVANPPNPVIVGATGVCVGQSQVPFFARKSAGSQLRWAVTSGIATPMNGTLDTMLFSFNTRGEVQIHLQETTAAGCVKDTSIQVIVSDSLSPVIQSVTGFNICKGASVQLDGGGADSYQWYQNASLLPGATQRIYTTQTAGVYVVQEHIGGCSGSSMPTVLRDVQVIKPTLTHYGGIEFCEGDSVTLSLNNSSSYQAIRWSSGETQDSIVVRASGLFFCVVDSLGCTSTSDSIMVKVTPKPRPVVVRLGNALTTGVFDSYQWLDSNGLELSGEQTRNFRPTKAGKYIVQVSLLGCSGRSDPYFFQDDASSTITISDCDFGSIPVDSVLERSGVLRSVVVRNLGLTEQVITDFTSDDGAFVPTQYNGFRIPAQDSLLLSLRFSPHQIRSYHARLLVSTRSGAQATSNALGIGRTLSPNEVVSEIALVPSSLELKPGELLTLRLRIQSMHPRPVSAEMFRAYFEYDPKVLSPVGNATTWQQDTVGRFEKDYWGMYLLHPRLAGVPRKHDTDGTIYEMLFITKLCSVDSTRIIFSGDSAFYWVQPVGSRDTALSACRDSIVHIRVCRQNGSQLIVSSPGTHIQQIAPNPVSDFLELEYSLGQHAQTELYLCDMKGYRCAEIVRGEEQLGTYRLKYDCSLLPNGQYLAVLCNGAQYSVQKVVILR